MPDRRTLRGHVKANSWVEYDLWYEIVFNQDIINCEKLSLNPGFKASSYVLDFGKGGKPLKFKISISYTSGEGQVKAMKKLPWE